MKAEILQKLRQQAAGGGTGTLPSSDMPKDASDVDLSRQYLDDFESRLVCHPGHFAPVKIAVLIIFIHHEW